MADNANWLYSPVFPPHWQRCQLYQMARWVNGLAFSKIHFSPSGRPVIKIAEVKNGITADTKRTEGSFGDDVRIKAGDLIFSWSGQPETSIDAFRWRGEDGWLNQHLFRVTPKDGIDPRFFYYLLKYLRPNFVSIARNKQTTGLGHVTRRDLERLAAAHPDGAEQSMLAEVLGALDDKIEANVRLVPLLRDLATVLLQRAADPATSYVVGQVADVRKGLSYKGSGLADAGMPMVNLANAADGGWLKRSGFKHYTGEYKPRHVAQPGSLLVSGVEQTWRNEILGWPMLLPDDVGPALFSQDVFLIDLAPENAWLRLPLWAHLYTAEARARLEGMVYGTTVARFRADALTELEFLAPAKGDPALGLAEDLVRRAWAAERENATLAELRDTLLPALMDGRIRVRYAERLVAGAT